MFCWFVVIQLRGEKLFKIGGGIIALVGAGLTFVAPPIGIAIGLLGAGLSFISNWFTSKAEKHRKAVVGISDALRSQVEQQKYSITEVAIQNLEKYIKDVTISINSYFYKLTEGLDDIASRLEKTQKNLDSTVNYLNRGYAKRIIDWSAEQYEPLSTKNVAKTIAKVDREFAHSIDIKTKTAIELKKSLDEMKQVLQEDISIESSQ